MNKTLAFVFHHKNFRTLGCSRTDAMVSAEDFAFELFCYELLANDFIEQFNQNLPADIEALTVQQVDEKFNIIKDVRSKTYHYHFSFGKKAHPFKAPFSHSVLTKLNIESMQQAAHLFIGTHNFSNYCYDVKDNTQLVRNILSSEILPDKATSEANAYYYKVRAEGFLRYQVRMMAGVLLEIGQGTISQQQLVDSLHNTDFKFDKPIIAPASGLVLHKVEFRQ